MDKLDYIKELRKLSTMYRDELVIMMDKYNKLNLREITYEEVKQYYEELKEKVL